MTTLYNSTNITASLEIVIAARLKHESKLAPIAHHYTKVETDEQDSRDRYKAFCYEVELAHAPESIKDVLRAECDGEPECVYAVLNDCIMTRNPILKNILSQLHGEDDFDILDANRYSSYSDEELREAWDEMESAQGKYGE